MRLTSCVNMSTSEKRGFFPRKKCEKFLQMFISLKCSLSSLFFAFYLQTFKSSSNVQKGRKRCKPQKAKSRSSFPSSNVRSFVRTGYLQTFLPSNCTWYEKLCVHQAERAGENVTQKSRARLPLVYVSGCTKFDLLHSYLYSALATELRIKLDSSEAFFVLLFAFSRRSTNLQPRRLKT